MLAPAGGFYSTPGLGKQEVRLAYVLNVASINLAMDCLEEGKSCSPEVRKQFDQLWTRGWEKR